MKHKTDVFLRIILSVALLSAKEPASDCLFPLLERGEGAPETYLLGVTTLEPC